MTGVFSDCIAKELEFVLEEKPRINNDFISACKSNYDGLLKHCLLSRARGISFHLCMNRDSNP